MAKSHRPFLMWPDKRLRTAAEAQPGVQLTGFVEDIRPVISSAAVYVCPMLDGGGTASLSDEAAKRLAAWLRLARGVHASWRIGQGRALELRLGPLRVGVVQKEGIALPACPGQVEHRELGVPHRAAVPVDHRVAHLVAGRTDAPHPLSVRRGRQR